MAYYDLREFMKACDAAGEMITIDKEVDWNLEAGAISRRICEIGAEMLTQAVKDGLRTSQRAELPWQRQ